MREYNIIRSSRKTLSLRVTVNGEVEVRAPYFCSIRDIDNFVSTHERWILLAIKRQRELAEKYPEPSEEERKKLISNAKKIIPQLIEHYSKLMEVYPQAITITGARTRFGSCSGNNRLSFSWRLMRYPISAVEAVVVHELAHIKHHNHSKDFYRFVYTVLPDYQERVNLLKQ